MCQINYCLGFGSLRSIHFTIVETQPIASLGILEYYHPKKNKIFTGEQMPTKKELEKRRDKRKLEEAEKNPKPKADEIKKDTEILKKQPEANKTKKHK